MKILDSYDFLRSIYAEIVIEKTACPELDGYIKHFGDLEYAEALSQKKLYLDSLIRDGVQTKEDKINLAIEQETWTLKDEDDLLSLSLVISDNSKLAESMIHPSQKKTIQLIVDEKMRERGSLLQKKTEAIGDYAEFFSDRRHNELIPISSIYEDKDLTKLKYGDAELDVLSRDELDDIRIKYNSAMMKFSDKNVRILACMPFLLNIFALCENDLRLFLNKSLAEYTIFQNDLMFKCLRNSRILKNVEESSPQINDTLDSQELLDWYDLNYSVLQGRGKSGAPSGGITTSTKIVSSNR